MGEEVKQLPGGLLDKAAMKPWRNNFALHVALLQKKHPALSKADATVQAYHEGVEGLNKRLG